MTTATTISSPLRLPNDERGFAVTALLYVSLALVAGVLGFAAVMKLMNAGDGGAGAVATAIFEFVVIAALIVFHRRWWAWVGVVALFAAFAGYTGHLYYRGASSCGCFGAVETPPLVTLSIDVALFALATLVAVALAKRVSVAPFVLTVAGFAAATGYSVSVATATPLPSDFKGDRAALLLQSPALEEVASSDLSGPDWLVYIYDERASESLMLDEVQAYEAEHPNDQSLRVRVLTAQEVEKSAGVPVWAWESLPQAMLVRAGQVTQRFMKEVWVAPTQMRATRPVGPIAQVLSLPEYADIAYASSDLPVYILYVYNLECPICIEHLAALEHFQEEYPNDPNVVIVPIPMQEMEEKLGLPIWGWPGVPTSYVVRGGRVIVQTATPQTVPNPYQIRMDIKMGKSLVLPPSEETAGHEGHGH